MTYANAVLEQINQMRETRVDLLQDGKTTQAAYVQRQIVKLYDRYMALTGDID